MLASRDVLTYELLRIVRTSGLPPEFEDWTEARKDLAEPEHDLVQLFAAETGIALQIAIHVASLDRPNFRLPADGLLEEPTNRRTKLSLRQTPFRWALLHPSRQLIELISTELGAMRNLRPAVDGSDRPIDIYRDLVSNVASQSVRHKRGAYFTPDWLARSVIANVAQQCDSPLFDKLAIEPASGTGAFVVALWDWARELIGRGVITSMCAGKFFHDQLTCIERDPLSALATEANILRALVELDPERSSESILSPRVIRGDAIQESRYLALKRQHELPLREPAPTLVEKYDIAIGNPPWISWENLEPTYRRRTAYIWELLGLFSSSGSKKAFSKEDFSTLFTYVIADQYLANGGKLAFIIPQSQLQSSLNGRGFRRFQIAHSRTSLRVDLVQDYKAVSIFKGAAAKAAVLYLTKGADTAYPVTYEIFEGTDAKMRAGIASPTDPSDLQSQWSVAPSRNPATPSISLRGPSPYRARTGVFTGGANAVYYLKHCRSKGMMIHATTAPEGAKRKLPPRSVTIEQQLVYPFIRGRDVSFWRADLELDRGIIIPHSIESRMAPIQPDELQKHAPAALEYFHSVRSFLEGRRGLTAMDRANCDRGFYAVLRVGAYTFSPYKLVWRYIHTEFTCAVVEPLGEGALAGKPIIPQEKLVMIPFSEREEAYFVCGILSSTHFRDAIHARMVSTQISASAIDQLAIPKFDENDNMHRELAAECAKGHEAAANLNYCEVNRIRRVVDDTVLAVLEARQPQKRGRVQR